VLVHWQFLQFAAVSFFFKQKDQEKNIPKTCASILFQYLQGDDNATKLCQEMPRQDNIRTCQVLL